MFERFLERARQVIVLAQDEACALNHNYIGTEHILLAIVHVTDGVAARILLDFDADPETIRNEVIRMISGPRRHSGAAAEGLAPEYRRVRHPVASRQVPWALLVGWALFAVACGLGLLAGWLIWG